MRMAIYQDLVDDHSFRARYASVRRFVVAHHHHHHHDHHHLQPRLRQE